VRVGRKRMGAGEVMPSAWHTSEDPREYGDPPLLLACDGCGRDVRLVAEDWHDNDAVYCPRCVAEAVCRPHPVEQWPDKDAA
jgi:hypothetical protein